MDPTTALTVGLTSPHVVPPIEHFSGAPAGPKNETLFYTTT